MVPGAQPRQQFLLDPDITFLNHGSFGACPRPVLEEQQRLRERIEREPVRFMLDMLEPELDRVRAALERHFGVEPAGVAFVPNATTAVASVLSSLELGAGDEIVVTDHAYAACHNVIQRAAAARQARVVVAAVPFPRLVAGEVVEAVLSRLSDKTRLVLIDHVTSPTALIFPVEEIVQRVQQRGIDVLVDGAHAPGMVPLDLKKLGAAYYAANFHKWCCAPKGAGMLYARADRRERLMPLVASHGMTSRRTDRSRYLLEFDWSGTFDPTAYLCVPAALDYLDGLAEGGLLAVARRNHELAVNARRLLARRFEAGPLCPEEMLGSMASLPLPPGSEDAGLLLTRQLFERHQVEVPIFPWPSTHSRLLRVSAQVYNEATDYERLADALDDLLR